MMHWLVYWLLTGAAITFILDQMIGDLFDNPLLPDGRSRKIAWVKTILLSILLWPGTLWLLGQVTRDGEEE
jgi:hypothetical protein